LEYKWLALTVTTIGVLMVGIDTRIVIIGLPQVSEQLHADIEQAIWITQAYVLTNTLMLSLIGRLGDIFGRVKIYTYGFAIFTVGSALTSIGQNPSEVIFFRGVQGIGSALFTLFLNIGLTVSLNLTVVIMSLTAPYDLITQILVAVNPASISSAGIALFVSSLKNTYFAFAIINAIAIIPAVIGGRIRKTDNTEPIVEAG
jgi:MFS family permease